MAAPGNLTQAFLAGIQQSLIAGARNMANEAFFKPLTERVAKAMAAAEGFEWDAAGTDQEKWRNRAAIASLNVLDYLKEALKRPGGV